MGKLWICWAFIHFFRCNVCRDDILYDKLNLLEQKVKRKMNDILRERENKQQQ
jgi:hypothetical protein